MGIVLLTGDVRSGKTTWLLDHVEGLKRVGGIISPDVGGRRKLYNIETQTYHEFEVDSTSHKSVLQIGRFHFLQESFEFTKDIVLQSLQSNSFTILDEYGKLEMQNQGFALFIDPILQDQDTVMQPNLLLVVRNSLVDDLESKFNRKFRKIEIQFWKDNPDIHLENLFL